MAKQEKWWKILPTSIFSFGILGALIGFAPDYSLVYLIIGMVLAILAIVGSAFQRIPGYERAKILTGQAVLMIFFLLGVRIWLHFLPNSAALIIPFGVAYILAWLIPYLDPRISQILWREQFSPETTLGKSILRIGLIVLPIGGASGAFIALYADRFSVFENLGKLMGPVVLLAIIGWAQVASHQIRKENHARDAINLK